MEETRPTLTQLLQMLPAKARLTVYVLLALASLAMTAYQIFVAGDWSDVVWYVLGLAGFSTAAANTPRGEG